MKRKKEEQTKKLIFLSLLIFFGITAIYNLPRKGGFWLESVFFILVSSILYFRFKKLPLIAHITLASILILGTLGNSYFELFSKTTYYDKTLHIINPLMLCLTFYTILKKKIRNKKINKWYSATITASIILLWEIIEYIMDLLIDSKMQGVFTIKQTLVISPLDDTMIDLILGILGITIFLIYKEIKRK